MWMQKWKEDFWKENHLAAEWEELDRGEPRFSESEHP